MSAVDSLAVGAEKRTGAGSLLLGRAWLCVAPMPRNHSEARAVRRASSYVYVGSRRWPTPVDPADPGAAPGCRSSCGRNRSSGPAAFLHVLVGVVFGRGSGILAASTREG